MNVKIRRRGALRTAATMLSAGALVAAVATTGAAAVNAHKNLPGYPAGKLTAADISMAAKYIGGKANTAAKGTPVKIGFLNDDAGTPAYPENVQGAQIALDLINAKLGGVKGHPLALDECSVNTDAQASTCATQMVVDGVKLVLTGTIALSNDTPMYNILFAAHIPVIEGNSITSPDFAPPKNGVAVTYLPGSPGVIQGMAKFIGQKGVGGKKPTSVTGFYLQGDTGSTTAFNLLFKTSKYLKGIPTTGIAIASPWQLSNVESALSGAQTGAGAVLVPIMPVAQCISFAQAMTTLHLKTSVVTTGLCFGKQLFQTLHTYPNGWYFGDYGVNYFMYSKTVAASAQLAVYIAAVHQYGPTIDYTGFAGPSFSNVLTVAKFYNKLGLAATSTQFASTIQHFAGPQWGVSGPMKCGFDILLPAVCGKFMGMAQFINKHWVPSDDAYNKKLINAFN
jgi:branched-chain amino acid transport system substrate-binding protein